MAHRLVFSIDIDDEENSVETARHILWELDREVGCEGYDIQVALVRVGDRSGGNLLLEKLSGRFGEHYQNRKASINEVLKDK